MFEKTKEKQLMRKDIEITIINIKRSFSIN